MSAEPPLLSLCMIVRDEESDLPACLASARELVDEIVVADTGSTDGTVAVAERAGAHVVHAPWENDFAKARNASLAPARGRFILVLDADERLDAPDVASLRRRLASTKDEAFTIEIHSPLEGGSVTVTPITRLFRNRPEHRYEGRVHEQILAAVARRAGTEGLSPPPSGLRVQHHGYLAEARRKKAKGERNEALLRAAIADAPDDPRSLYLLAREISVEVGGDLLRIPANREALTLLERAHERVGSARFNQAADLAARRLRLAVLLQPERSIEDALAAANKKFGQPPLLRFARGEAALASDAPDAARAHFEGVLGGRFEPAQLADVDPRYTGVWAHERIARAHLAAGRPDEAARTAAALREKAPAEAGPRLVLARTHHAAGRVKEALVELVTAAKHAPQDPRPLLAMAELFAAMGDAARGKELRGAARKLAPGWEDAED